MTSSTAQARILWCDAEANSHRLASRVGVADVVRKAKKARVNTIVVDVKPLSGEVLYLSRIAPRLRESKGNPYPATFDLLQTMLEEGHAEDIRIHANINVFSEGHRHWGRGPGYDHPEWQVVSYEIDHGSTEPSFRRAQDSCIPTFGVFINPIGPAREYELSIIREIVSGYDIDGIVFDRMRYPNIHADFSDLSRAAFASWLGGVDIDWPNDIFTIRGEPEPKLVRGRFYRQWLEWRAQTIKDFAVEAAGLVRSLRPLCKVGVYVGSWYDSYFDVGVNWGSEQFHAGYEWMTPSYNRTGYAEVFDYICTGCYYPHSTREEARRSGADENSTVEAGCDLSVLAVNGASRVYGSLYVLDYEARPSAFRQAVEVVLERTEGIMLFDLVYLEQYDWWSILSDLFREDALAPHDLRAY